MRRSPHNLAGSRLHCCLAQVMLDDVAACKQLGADGVVVGCLAPNGDVDMDATRALVGAARTQVRRSSSSSRAAGKHACCLI